MTFLDTNVILRYLLNDHPDQSPRVQARLAGEESFTVPAHILVEVAVVLEKVYALSRAQLVPALSAFVAQSNLAVSGLNKPLVLAALNLCQPSKRVGFADAFLWAEAMQSESATVLTFDQRFPSQHPEPLWSTLGTVPIEEP